MKTTVLLAAAILIMPSILQAQSRSRPARPAARTAFRGAAVVTHKAAAPRVYRSSVSQASAPAASNPARTARLSTASQAARPQAIQPARAGGMGSFNGTDRARSARNWSSRFDRLSFQRRGSFTARRADAPAGESSQTDSPPPYLYTPGALIRTEGLGYDAVPANDARWQTTAPGYAIVQDPNQSILLNPFPGIRVGPADKLPPPNPWGSGRASGRNAITPNAVVFSDSDEHNRDQGGKPDNPKDKDK
jgi:hypothetical protein